MTTRLLRLAGVCAGLLNAPAAGAEPARVVLELFTSQGCSSCPPADRLFAGIAERPEIISLTLPVDYWDRLGWKDTLASPSFTARQRAYSQQRGDGEIYTPQAVVNGARHFVGSRSSGVDAALSGPSELEVRVDVVKTGEGLVVTAGAAAETSQGSIIAMPILSAQQVAIGRGENANTTVVYTNVVRGIDTVAKWTGKPVRLTLPIEPYIKYDGVVVLVQRGSEKEPGPILGAAKLQFR
jgi:hypothetical protein